MTNSVVAKMGYSFSDFTPMLTAALILRKD
jgi:hypothetical protein